VRAVAVTAVIAAGAAACAPAWKNTPHDQMFQSEGPARLGPRPGDRSVSDWWDLVDQTTFRQLGRVLSPGFYVSGVMGGRHAQDVNGFGQVPSSGWFVNRIGRHDVAANSVYHGAATDDGPAPGELVVISGKLEGASAGFVVRDRDGITWYVKLDHPAFPQLSTSAELISSRLLWLAGYWVPAMHLVDIERDRLVLDPKARRRDKYNNKVAMTKADLVGLLTQTNPDKVGRIRVLMSREPVGDVLGPFEYQSRRSDDPNDLIDHEHRRTLRGLWLFSAWLNNIDTRSANTLDVFVPVTADGRGVVQHYLIDFGDSLGATSDGEKALVEGNLNVLDWPEVGKNLLTLGVRYPAWQFSERSEYRSVGLFESDAFDPWHWSPTQPNPAFEQRTRSDEFWAASILARIQPEHIRAAVIAGTYRKEGAATYVIQQLLARREKLLNYAFIGFLEVDRPQIEGDALLVDDLRALGGLPDTGPIKYTIRWNRTRASDEVLARGELSHPADRPHHYAIDLAPALATAQARKGFASDPFVTVKLTRKHKSASIHLRRAGTRWLAVGLDR
jgi:hypothetical protein